MGKRNAGVVLLAAALLAAVSLAACTTSGEGRAGMKNSGAQMELTPTGTVENGVRVIEVTAKRYEFIPKEIVVNEGDRVELDVTAIDRTHGFEMDDFHIKQRLNEGETEKITFTADKVGRHNFHCFVYCGPGHPGMKGELVVLPAKKQEPVPEGETQP